MSRTQGIDGQTHLVTLFGNPTAHSLSPALHNLSFELLGINAVYLCFDIEREGLEAVMAGFNAIERWDGANVTMPFKQAIIPYLDGIDDAAQLVGAVNVVKKVDGKPRGYNTDGVGFMRNLARYGVQAAGSRMVLLGPGGAGRAILAQAALDGVAHIDVFARAGGQSYAAAAELASRVESATGCAICLHDLASQGDLESCVQDADVLVNATPVGMGAGSVESPIPASFLHSGLVVADAIYEPRKTQLIRDAERLGCVCVPGLGMLVEQAAAGEAIWYGVEMPVREIENRLFGD